MGTSPLTPLNVLHLFVTLLFDEFFTFFQTSVTINGLVESLYRFETENTQIITNGDICYVMQQLECHKSCGPDDIPAEAIKKLWSSVICALNVSV